MKRILLSVLFVVCIIFTNAQVRLPQPSPTQTISQNFGMSSIELTYSRPGVKGRKIFGGLLPYDSLWRTGANASTKIKFNDPVEIMGNKVDTGTYAIFTIPAKDSWTFILSRGINYGTSDYKKSEDVVRLQTKPKKLSPQVETFTMQFANIKPESCDLLLRWDDIEISIPIKTNIKEKLRVQLDSAMQAENKPYWVAAQFYSEYDNNKPKALEMINKAIEQNQKDNPFYMVHYKAKIQKDMGDNAGARASANQSIAMSKEAKNYDYVTLNEKLLKELK